MLIRAGFTVTIHPEVQGTRRRPDFLAERGDLWFFIEAIAGFDTDYEIRGKDDQPVPLIVQKADGGFGYAASDLTAIRNRVVDLHATTLLYVVDVRQSLHFKMVFETARRAGWLSDGVRRLPRLGGCSMG